MTNSNLPNTITSFSVIIHSKIQVIDTPIQTFCPHSTFLVDITLDILASTIRKGKYRLERKVIKLQRHYCRKSQRNNKNKNWTVTIARLQDIRLTYKSPLLSRILTMNDWNLKSINSKKAHISPLELKLELGWRKWERWRPFQDTACRKARSLRMMCVVWGCWNIVMGKRYLRMEREAGLTRATGLYTASNNETL